MSDENSTKKIGREGNELIQGRVIRLDYGTFEKKTFYKCNIVYAGGLPPTLIDCDFIESAFLFEGPALFTTQFMAQMANSSGGGRDLVLSMVGLK